MTGMTRLAAIAITTMVTTITLAASIALTQAEVLLRTRSFSLKAKVLHRFEIPRRFLRSGRDFLMADSNRAKPEKGPERERASKSKPPKT